MFASLISRRCYSSMNRTVCFVGGGNGTHVGAPVCAQLPDVNVNILTRKPDAWKKDIKLTYPDGRVRSGSVDLISDAPHEAIADADIVFVSSPVCAYEEIFSELAPYVKRGAYIGVLFCQGFPNLAMHAAMRSAWGRTKRDDVTYFGLQHIPWQAKTIKYGEHGHLVGAKSELNLATTPAVRFDGLASEIESLFGIRCIDTPFLATALSTSNQILHPVRYFTMFGPPAMPGMLSEGEAAESFGAAANNACVPYLQRPLSEFGPGSLYTDMDEESAALLHDLDRELTNIRSRISNLFPDVDFNGVKPLIQRIKAQYGDQVGDYSSMKSTFNTATMYNKSKFAVKNLDGKIVPDILHRHFLDDLPFGLCVLKDLAVQADVSTPLMDQLIHWHGEVMGKNFFLNREFHGLDSSKSATLRHYNVHSIEDYVSEKFLEDEAELDDASIMAQCDELLREIDEESSSEFTLVFDLDRTIWRTTVETFPNMSDDDIRAAVVPEAIPILRWCQLRGVSLATASRAWKPECTERFLQVLGISNCFPHRAIWASGLNRAANPDWPRNKLSHFMYLRGSLQQDYSQMVFFDDSIEHVLFSRELGVHSVHCPGGISWSLVRTGLEKFLEQAKKSEHVQQEDREPAKRYAFQ